MSIWRSFKGITAYVGPMGNGKTYLMTRDVLRALRRGQEVWANAGYSVVLHSAACNKAWHAIEKRDRGADRPECECEPRTKTYVSLSEMLLAPPGTKICLDEVGTFMNARRWTELPRSLMYRLTQARKDELTLTYTAQHELQVDVALRRLTQIVHTCKRIGPLLMAVAYPPTDYRRAEDRPMHRQWALLRRWVMNGFDTTARVWVPPETIDELMTETSKWVPLDDNLMQQLREHVVAARELADSQQLTDELAGSETLDIPLPPAQHAGSLSGEYRRFAGGDRRKSNGRRSLAPRGEESTNGNRRQPSKTADNGDIPAFYFD